MKVLMFETESNKRFDYLLRCFERSGHVVHYPTVKNRPSDPQSSPRQSSKYFCEITHVMLKPEKGYLTVVRLRYAVI